MSETPFRKVKYDFQRFVSRLTANKARNSRCFDTDPPREPQEEVSRREAVDTFLKQNPQHVEFREQLLEPKDKREKYFFKTDAWKQEQGK